MGKSGIAILLLALASMLAGFLLPFWPLALLAVALAAFYSNIVAAVVFALLSDLYFGPPIGPLSIIPLPFFFFALLCIVLKVLALRYILKRDDLGRV